MFGWNEKDYRDARPVPEMSGETAGARVTGQNGFISGTHVASNLGWRAVEVLCVGDKVLTFDHGMQKISHIQREILTAPDMGFSSEQSPLLVPEGALYNRRAMWLLPEQGLMVEYDAAEDPLGDPFSVIPASALHGFRGIERRNPGRALEVTVLTFAKDEVIYIEGGMLAHCPTSQSKSMDIDGALYDVMSTPTAEFLVECLSRKDDSADAFTCDPDEIAFVSARRGRPVRHFETRTLCA